MKKVIGPISLVTLMVFALVMGFASLSQAADEAAGKALFLENKCNLCHSIESQGIAKKSEKMKGAELSDVGNRISDADWVKSFLKKEEAKDGDKHKKEFKGTEAQLDTLVNWLMSLKKS